MRVLVTGATGFVGRALLPALADEHELVALARREPPPALADLARWLRIDLAQALDPGRLPDRIDVVVHLAQSERYRDFPDGARDMFDVNVRSTLDLLEYARGAGAARFVLASSGSVYGHGSRPIDEDAPPAPRGLYASSRLAAELLVRSYAPLLDTVVLRFFSIYGPGQTGMLFPTLAGRVERGETIEIQGDPGMRINPIYVDDAVRAIAAAIALQGQHVLNVCGSETVSLAELVALIGEAAELPVDVRHLPSDAVTDLVGDNARMVEHLGVAPVVGVREGVARLVAGGSLPA